MDEGLGFSSISEHMRSEVVHFSDSEIGHVLNRQVHKWVLTVYNRIFQRLTESSSWHSGITWVWHQKEIGSLWKIVSLDFLPLRKLSFAWSWVIRVRMVLPIMHKCMGATFPSWHLNCLCIGYNLLFYKGCLRLQESLVLLLIQVLQF